MTRADRVLAAVPTARQVGADAYRALADIGSVTLVSHDVSLDEVRQFDPTVLIATVSDALYLGQAAALDGVELAEGAARLVVVTGEPGGSLSVTRRILEGRWGARCVDVYALAELGILGAGCGERGDGLHLDDATFQFELVDPDTDRPVAPGEIGELVATGRREQASVHTGDLVRMGAEGCACGGRLWAEGGVLGRVGERMLVRGTLLLPSTIEQVVRRHPAVVDFRLRVYEVRGECQVEVLVEPTAAVASEGDRARVAAEVSEDLRRSLGLRLACDVLAPGSVAGDQDAGRRARRFSRQ